MSNPSLRFIVTPIELFEMVERGQISTEVHYAYGRLLGLAYEQTGSQRNPVVDVTFEGLAALWRMKPRGARQRVTDMEQAGLVRVERRCRPQVRLILLVIHGAQHEDCALLGGPRHEERRSPSRDYAPVGSGGIYSSAASARSAAPMEGETDAASVSFSPPVTQLTLPASTAPPFYAASVKFGPNNVVVVERDDDKARVRAPDAPPLKPNYKPHSRSDAAWRRPRDQARAEKLQSFGVIAAHTLAQEIRRAIDDGRIDELTITPPSIAKEYWAIRSNLPPDRQHMAAGLLVSALRAIMRGVKSAGGRQTDDG